jgi:two-component system sensor histidine kinase PilS (NtrC family)
MDDADREAHAQRRRLRILLVARVVAALVLLGSATVARLRLPDPHETDGLFLLLAVVFALAAVWTAAVRAMPARRWLVDAQMAADAVVVSVAVLLTGGLDSLLVPLYGLPVVAASVLQYRRGGLLVAALNTLLYGAIIALQYSVLGLGPVAHALGLAPTPLPPVEDALVTLALNGAGFAIVAWLTGYLAERVQHGDERLRQASTQIADLQAFTQCVINSLTGGLVTTDQAGKVLTLNRAGQQILGWQAEAAGGRAVADVLQLPRELVDALPRMVDSGRARRVDVEYETPSGRRVDLGLTAAPLMGGAGRVGYLFTFQDITERKRRDREVQTEKRMAAIGEMAAGIAHEIRNPLASMAGSVQVLRQDLELSAEQARLMDIVLRESRRLNDIIRSFLAYARPQRRSPQPVDVVKAVREAAALLEHGTERGPAHVMALETPEAPCYVDADEGEVRQVVWNLATNALKAMPAGGRLLFTVQRSAHQVRLCVRDEGVGISPAHLDHVFEPFRSGFPSGTGLGLAIVHRIVTDLGGSIDIESAPGAGTSVEVTLPAAVAADHVLTLSA